ncbi:hypothetical protein FHT21_000779 [Pedobacter sp. SG908]|nr:hypothetical protein [Pedobacter sp. SG908]NMN35738.1 hypothetical protein [Pedobacter sp. SG918]
MNESMRGYAKIRYKRNQPTGTVRPMTEEEIKQKGWVKCK